MFMFTLKNLARKVLIIQALLEPSGTWYQTDTT